MKLLQKQTVCNSFDSEKIKPRNKLKEINSVSLLFLKKYNKELKDSKLKKYYIMQLPGALLDPGSKSKKIHLEKISLYFRKWNFLALILKNFRKQMPEKNSLYFREQKP